MWTEEVPYQKAINTVFPRININKINNNLIYEEMRLKLRNYYKDYNLKTKIIQSGNILYIQIPS